jgi:asparagine synthase (glutamine-hydrolysing)
LCVDDNKNQLSVKTYRYYRFIHKYEKNQTLEESMEELDHVLVGMFNRLIQVADGRTIVVPLSGGFDSRLIVLMLKRLGYNNVIAYTYGCLGIAEAEVSRHVAASLGIRWEFVTYNNQLWYELYNSNHMKLYQTLAAGLSSTIVIQDFPAVHIMTKNNIINGDSIFVPGHSADLLAGSRSISFPKIYSTKLVNDFKVIESVKKRHYSLTNVREQKSIYINKRVISVLEPIRQFPDNASAFESWDLSERQAKFIINSVRIYEFMGYQWWLPFWDEKFMSYWEKIPLEYRVRQLLYKQYVDKLYREVTGEAPPHLINNRSTIDNIENVIKTSLKKNKLTNYILDKSGLDKGHLKRKYNSEPMAFYGVISEEDFIRLKPTDIDYLLALLYIEVLNNREH